jgi:excisionase family DNA binding protein
MVVERTEEPDRQLLTITELSERSRLSVTQLRRLVKAGRIPFLQPGGRGGKLLFRLDTLLAANEPPKSPHSEPKVPPHCGRKPDWMQP